VKNYLQSLQGITDVSNNIIIKADINNAVEKANIESTLKRNLSFYDNDIKVTVSGYKATFTGTVDSCYPKKKTSRIAYNAHGVRLVDLSQSVFHLQ